MKTVSVWIFALAVVGLAAGCGSGPKDPTKGSRIVRVVAAENVWGDIARQIGGRHASVASIISDPSADPHLYTTDPRTAARLAQANLVIVNGQGYDDWAAKLLGAAPVAKRHRLTIAAIVRPAGHDPNPHLWYDVARLPLVASGIAAAFAGEDPRDGGYFRANARHFVAALAPLRSTVAAIRARHAGAPVAYTERVPGYLLDAAGITSRTPRGFAAAIESGSEPSPGDTQRMNDLIARHRIKVLVYNAQAVTPVTKRLRSLAARSGVPVVAVTETLPRTETSFQAWQLHQAQALLRALGG